MKEGNDNRLENSRRINGRKTRNVKDKEET